MAELILNCRGPHKGPGAESYYDFDSANEATLEAIEIFLARRSVVPATQEEYLAELCAQSVNDGATVLRRATLFGWLEILRNLYCGVRDSSGNNTKRGRRPGGKPGNGSIFTGSRRRLSFA